MQILLTVAYDGTNYAGWQRQENALAIQEKLENALSALLDRTITVRAASRTDAGVHAMGQRASFFAPDLKIPIAKLPEVLIAYLPQDISVTAAEVVSEEFNPRFGAVQKTYVYNIYNAPCPNPLLHRYSAFVPRPLDLSAMQTAAAFFVGKHDFAAFCATGGNAKTTVREIFACEVSAQPNGLISLTVTGNAFLYNMVRIIAGTIVYAGLGKFPPQQIPQIITSLKRENAGKTMPAQGLVLMEVVYALSH
ncbi:MAG: tRNA pseudouridine(38-40) synthase TruA [Defluviitaleaceae bacterium]|nr:tRNA pseudouridine(38-40) synthase TruA [Defluviitaleaceae bacterium]MCL2263107.1 tRNA pseudouridine(38-40) synthase TruA [Defluviitaleaceae bacterium]